MYPKPPITHTQAGSERRVGVEVELGELPIDVIAERVAHLIGGVVVRNTRYECEVQGDPAGSWVVELDSTFLKEWGRVERDEDSALDSVDELIEAFVRLGAERFVPHEVVTPPLPISRLHQLDELIDDLRVAGARGTAAGLTYAFGLQLNVEMPACDAGTIIRYLKAFACLYDWLAKRAEVDLTRRLTAFADPYPLDYVRRLVDHRYRPSLDQLMDDYLAAMPDRNRALDLLPLFMHLDERRVRDRVASRKLKARPALHYRLPNCEIDRPGWGLRDIWDDWLVLERLANDSAHLRELGARYAHYIDDPLSGLLTGGWLGPLEDWLRVWRSH